MPTFSPLIAHGAQEMGVQVDGEEVVVGGGESKVLGKLGMRWRVVEIWGVLGVLGVFWRSYFIILVEGILEYIF